MFDSGVNLALQICILKCVLGKGPICDHLCTALTKTVQWLHRRLYLYTLPVYSSVALQ